MEIRMGESGRFMGTSNFLVLSSFPPLRSFSLPELRRLLRSFASFIRVISHTPHTAHSLSIDIGEPIASQCPHPPSRAPKNPLSPLPQVKRAHDPDSPTFSGTPSEARGNSRSIVAQVCCDCTIRWCNGAMVHCTIRVILMRYLKCV